MPDVDKPISEGVQRIILEQINEALNNLVDPAIDRDLGVHEARKNLKRIRAALRLVRFELGERPYKRENIIFRDCGRLLAPTRDAYVMLESLDKLVEHYGGLLSAPALADFRQQLTYDYEAARRQLFEESVVLPDATETLRVARERIAGMPAAPDNFEQLGKGLKRICKRGRKEMAAAYEELTAVSFHEWRKRVKYLMYQLEFLAVLRPLSLQTLNEELDLLSDYLGEEHDLAVLHEKVDENPTCFEDEGLMAGLVKLIAQRRTELELAARPLGEQIYEDRPGNFVGRILGI
jgi:CHAD domain-containing protein